jgi:hypothetical protein
VRTVEGIRYSGRGDARLIRYARLIRDARGKMERQGWESSRVAEWQEWKSARLPESQGRIVPELQSRRVPKSQSPRVAESQSSKVPYLAKQLAKQHRKTRGRAGAGGLCMH